MAYKSILRQIQKDKNQTKLTFSTRDERMSGNPIVDKIDDPEVDDRHDIIKVEDSTYNLSKVEAIYKWSDILYPKEMIDMYEGTYTHRKFASESDCDNALTTFMKNKFSSSYLASYVSAVNQNIKRLMMLRILVATFCFSENPRDNLPSKHRATACKFLNIPHNISLPAAQDMMENLQKMSNYEDMILGRLGYMIVWHDLATIEQMSGKPGLDGRRVFYLPHNPNV